MRINARLVATEVREDTNERIQGLTCFGCGSLFNCIDPSKPGYINEEYAEATTRAELQYKRCERCTIIRDNKPNLRLNIDYYDYDYDKNVLDKILSIKKNILVILLIDLTNMPNSIYDGWAKLIKTKKKNETPFASSNIDICIIGNKLDILPNTGGEWIEKILECLEKNCSSRGIDGEQVKCVELISAKTGYNVEKLISYLINHWNNQGRRLLFFC